MLSALLVLNLLSSCALPAQGDVNFRIVEEGGAGSWKSVVVEDAALPGVRLYTPKDLSAAVERTTLPVVLVDDFLRHPEHAEPYRVIFFNGMHHRDAKREALLRRLAAKGVKCVFLSAAEPVSPMDFLRIVREAGGYVPARYGLEVDMNGSFVSVHALRGGRFDFILPRRCTVTNLKSGKVEVRDAEMLPLDLIAGETCWFRLD